MVANYAAMAYIGGAVIIFDRARRGHIRAPDFILGVQFWRPCRDARRRYKTNCDGLMRRRRLGGCHSGSPSGDRGGAAHAGDTNGGFPGGTSCPGLFRESSVRVVRLFPACPFSERGKGASNPLKLRLGA
jgi:hypothetical protein